MKGREKEKADEIAGVPIANTCTDPGTVVVVHFHTDAAGATVEGARRPEDLTGGTVGQFIVLILSRTNLNLALFIILRNLIAKLFNLVKPCRWILDIESIEVFFLEVFCIVVETTLGYLLYSRG